MVCEYYCMNGGKCRKMMPITGLYKDLICKRKPEKCPVLYFSHIHPVQCH